MVSFSFRSRCALVALYFMLYCIINGSAFIGRHMAYNQAYNDWHNKVSVDQNGTKLTPENTIFVRYDAGIIPAIIFDQNIAIMSSIFKDRNVTLNYVNIGACDGINDNTQNMYWKDSTMRGLFIEPLEANVKDFEARIDENGARARTTMIRAAVNETCPKKILEFERPKVIDGPTEHWIRREIGRIKRDVFDPSWVSEFVRCLTFEQIISEWHDIYRKRAAIGQEPRSNHRPHAVKIDTEGNDHAIVRSILRYPPKNLPLMILYEVKTYKSTAINEIRELLHKHGYSTNINSYRADGSFYFDDVIAILRRV